MSASYICNRIPHLALNMEMPYEKREGRRPLPSQDPRRKGLRTHQKLKQARPHVVGRGGVWLQRDREQLLPHLELKHASCGGGQERCFHRITTKLLSATRRHLPQQDLESLSYDFSDDTLDDSYVSHGDMLRDVQNYTLALDFGVDTPAGTVVLLLPQQASHGVTSPGGALPAGVSPGGFTPEGSSPPLAPTPAQAPGPAPTPAFAAPRATNEHANRGTVGVTPPATHCRAASTLPVPVATRSGGGRSNNIATLAECFEAGTLQRLSELELGPRTSHTRWRTPVLM